MYLSVDRTPFFEKKAWQDLDPRLGGRNKKYESAQITDVWSLPVSAGKNGPAEFPLALAGRCIALTSRKGDLVLDPFVGSGTTAVAAVTLSRRFLGYDIGDKYIERAERRLIDFRRELQLPPEEMPGDAESSIADAAETQTSAARRPSRKRQAGPDNSCTVVGETQQSQSA